jgi:hypothetical protein
VDATNRPTLNPKKSYIRDRPEIASPTSTRTGPRLLARATLRRRCLLPHPQSLPQPQNTLASLSATALTTTRTLPRLLQGPLQKIPGKPFAQVKVQSQTMPPNRVPDDERAVSYRHEALAASLPTDQYFSLVGLRRFFRRKSVASSSRQCFALTNFPPLSLSLSLFLSLSLSLSLWFPPYSIACLHRASSNGCTTLWLTHRPRPPFTRLACFGRYDPSSKPEPPIPCHIDQIKRFVCIDPLPQVGFRR